MVQVQAASPFGRSISLFGTSAILGNYGETINKLLHDSISENTGKVYKQGMQSFYNFRVNCEFQQTWPPPLDHILNFIAYLSEQGCSFSTVKCYMSGISFLINLNGWNNPLETFLVKKLMAGYKKSSLSCDMRRPITLALLHRLLGAVPHLAFSTYEAVLFQSSFALAFFALLRVSEVIDLRRDDIQILGSGISVFIKSSKTDQLGSGASVWVPNTSESVLLVNLLKEFSLLSSKIDRDVYFAHFNSKTLTQFQFSSMLQLKIL